MKKKQVTIAVPQCNSCQPSKKLSNDTKPTANVISLYSEYH